MSKLYNHPVEVQLSPGGLILAFRWRGFWYRVARCRVIRGKQVLPWYHFQNPYLPRYRCETKQGMVCDLIREREGWKLERVWD
ncbi:MAG: hypothetical protein QHH75_05750 [Bacillota bacterium]|nr:hypothetical protein [Bacillota bacterium]